MPLMKRPEADILCIDCTDGAQPCICGDRLKKMRDPDALYALARSIVEERTLTPAYLADDEDWYAAVDEAREALGIVAKAPMCQYCGNVAPYGDARHGWIGWHQSRIHRWYQTFKHKWFGG